MKIISVPSVALTCQLLAFSAGVCFAAPNQDPSAQVTADQSKNNKADRELTAKIRESIVADKSLSVSAHNVKIITQDGTVTLRGKVKSEEERQAIADKATELAGTGKVTNDLIVSQK